MGIGGFGDEDDNWVFINFGEWLVLLGLCWLCELIVNWFLFVDSGWCYVEFSFLKGVWIFYLCISIVSFDLC